MSGDIVERLRESTGFKVHHTDDGPVITADVKLLSEAADAIEARDTQIQNLLAAFSAVVEDAITKTDQIERLRAALVAIQSEAHTFGDGCSDVYVQTLDLVWEMAHKALSEEGPS